MCVKGSRFTVRVRVFRERERESERERERMRVWLVAESAHHYLPELVEYYMPCILYRALTFLFHPFYALFDSLYIEMVILSLTFFSRVSIRLKYFQRPVQAETSTFIV